MVDNWDIHSAVSGVVQRAEQKADLWARKWVARWVAQTAECWVALMAGNSAGNLG